MNDKEMLERIAEDMGTFWIKHVKEAAKHEWHKHSDYRDLMSLQEYQSYRIVQQYNHLQTHLEWEKTRSEVDKKE